MGCCMVAPGFARGRQGEIGICNSSGVYICNSIVNDLRHGNFICKSYVNYLRGEAGKGINPRSSCEDLFWLVMTYHDYVPA